MSDWTATPTGPETALWRPRTLAALAALAVVIAAADAFTFTVAPGLGLGFAFAILTLMVMALDPFTLRRPRTLALATLALLAAATFAEAFSPHFVLVALALNSVLALDRDGYLGRFADWLDAGLRFLVMGPVRLVSDGLVLIVEAGRQRLGSRLWRVVLVSVVPLVFALIFGALFVAANPLFESAVGQIHLDRLFTALDADRILFWLLVAAAVWPILVPRLMSVPTGFAAAPVQGPQRESLIFGRVAIRNGLIVFNVIFAAQMLSDLLFLWGGIRLPDGMTYADYAHRGAYPLIVAALLAAAFVLVTMRRNGPGRADPLIRGLVYSWIGLTFSLVVASVTRLDLYVDAYGLTELRLYAGIWMGLVAIGLLLIVVKIVADWSNAWLVMANLVALTVTLWGVALVNVPAIIAWHNVLHAREAGGDGVPLDLYQMTALGPEAIPALDHFLATARFETEEDARTFWLLRANLEDDALALPTPPLSWTWRGQRLLEYLAGHPEAPTPCGGLFGSGGMDRAAPAQTEEGRCRASSSPTTNPASARSSASR